MSRNGAPVNIVYHSWNADSEAFRQVSSYIKKVTLYTIFGQLVLRKSIEIVASRCHILRLKNSPNSISAGAPAQTPLGKLTALPRPLAGFEGPTSKEGEGKGGREGEGKDRRGR